VRFFLLILLLSCSPYRIFKKDYITLSESPCVDGTILNMDQAGCESFYWGTQPKGITLKIRCTYAPKRSFWSERDFYAIPHNYEPVHAGWGMYCEDRYVKMYAVQRGARFEIKSN